MKKLNLKDYLSGKNVDQQEDLSTLFHDANQYQEYLTDATNQTMEQATNLVQTAALNGNENANQLLQSAYKGKENLENKMRAETEQMIRTLKNDQASERRAGYIQASILLYSVLVFGIFIAVFLILFQN